MVIVYKTTAVIMTPVSNPVAGIPVILLSVVGKSVIPLSAVGKAVSKRKQNLQIDTERKYKLIY